MFTAPGCASLAIFPDKNSKMYAGTAVAILAGRTKFHQAVTQFIMVSWRRWWRDCDRLTRRRAIFWRNDEPRSVGPLLITSVLIISVATRSRLALCRDGSARYTTDNCTSCRSSAAAYCAANDGSGCAPPRIAPPSGSCAAASCTGIASAMARKAEAPKARYIRPSLGTNTPLSTRCVETKA